jgi:heme-degrading monooxygenase HmoA
MNRFRITKGSEEAFEKVWLSRDSHLDKVPGFVEFHLLKGPEAEDHTLYASHTLWENRTVFSRPQDFGQAGPRRRIPR